ncbi:hypothetical protein FKM82_002285 [Ascaphus truei]
MPQAGSHGSQISQFSRHNLCKSQALICCFGSTHKKLLYNAQIKRSMSLVPAFHPLSQINKPSTVPMYMCRLWIIMLYKHVGPTKWP